MKRKKGISLIVLVITIIVIIILAGSVILNLSKNNPIESAKKAKFLSDIDTFKSDLVTYILSKSASTQGRYNQSLLSADINSLTENGDPADNSKNITSVITSMKNTKYAEILEIVSGELVYVGDNENEIIWAEGIIKVGKFEVPEYAISNPAGTEASPGTSKNVNTTINGKNPTYNNPVIPAGFMAINTNESSWTLVDGIPQGWNNGLVIQDNYGNQFVWVPVDGTNVKYEKWTTSGVAYNHADISDDIVPSGFSDNNITDKYKGFYIARYESAFDYNSGNIRAASKKSVNKSATNWSSTRNETYNGYLWNYINYTEAKSYSENMANAYSYNTSFLITNLVTGTQWDTVMKWIQNSGKSVTDSRTWGNYIDSTSPANISGFASLQISGYSEYWKAKNIYDLAGNTWEWTNEKYATSFVNRGGVYDSSGSSSPVSRRGSASSTSRYNLLSFRLALHIK